MSLTAESSSVPEVGILSTTRPHRPLGASIWVRVALAVSFLAAAGGVRAWQAHRIDDFLRQNQDSPFKLDELPLTLGHWKGKPDTLPSEIASATGCKDYILRNYTDERTGVRISVIVLYGPPMDVIEHAPEECYPRAGYTMTEGPSGRQVPVGDHHVPFSSMVFQKGDGGATERQEVFYTWHYGRWTPQRALTKQIERIPGMYKVHLSRPVGERELLDQGSPCESLLALLIPEIDRRIAEPAHRPAPAPSPRPTAH